MDEPDWLKEASESGLTPAQAAQEARQAELEDSGAALLRSFEKLRRLARRLIDRSG